MVWLDPAVRSATIAILAAMALVLLRDVRRIPVAGAAVGFFLTIAAHLVLTAPDYTGIRGLDGVLMAAAFAVPGAFLLFSRAFFDDERERRWSDVAMLAALVATGFIRGTSLAAVGAGLFYGGSLTVVGIALAGVVRGLSIDLIEPRRRLRVVLTITVGLTIMLVIAGEVLLAGDRPPRWVDTVKSCGALALALWFATWLLSPRTDLFVAQAAGPVPAPAPLAGRAPSEDDRFRERLLTLMRDERAYRQEGLTIAVLARMLDLPEYRLRRVINQQLGYRNFNAFVNDFRIDEACRMLADPAHERLPILNLALDLGYGSPGAFNRAFRTRTGLTPTEYRRSRLDSSSPTA